MNGSGITMDRKDGEEWESGEKKLGSRVEGRKIKVLAAMGTSVEVGKVQCGLRKGEWRKARGRRGGKCGAAAVVRSVWSTQRTCS